MNIIKYITSLIKRQKILNDENEFNKLLDPKKNKDFFMMI